MKKTDDLKLKLDTLPNAPGVYMFKNAAGKIVYIGKAKVLRNRVRSYFQSSRNVDRKTRRMLAQAVDFDLMVTESEVEALILEANLVHQYKPRYNVMLKDDKHFPYIKVTTNEPFPRVLIVRRLDKDGATYFGPYTNARRMRKTVTFLTRLFRIRTCNLVIPHPKGMQYKVCLDYHIKRCGGPCEALQSEESYRESVDAVIMALSGKSRKLIDRLTEKMQVAAEEMKFELAAELRDQIEALHTVMMKQTVDVGEMIDRDIVALARENSIAVAVVMQLREGVLVGRQDFQLQADETDSNETVLETFIAQYYHAQPNLPNEVFLPFDWDGLDLIAAYLREMAGRKISVFTPKIGPKVKLVDLAARNAQLLLDEVLIQKRHQTERTSKMVTALKDELKLNQAPRRIVCFDISNTGETDAVGSCVCFDNGKPKKSEYRKFKIKGVAGQDDFKMMRQVVGRYFRRLAEEKRDAPDLVVVDGGKGQLSSAQTELHQLGFTDQLVIGLAKRLEEVFVPEVKDSIVISRSSPALMLLKQLRDEAHRFAIEYNRNVRSKRTITSQLDNIRGIGPARREALLKKFGSVKRIREATPEQLAELPGINAKMADTILRQLQIGSS